MFTIFSLAAFIDCLLPESITGDRSIGGLPFPNNKAVLMPVKRQSCRYLNLISNQ